MTSNNLEEHIAWLLTVKPFVPQAQITDLGKRRSTIDSATQSQSLYDVELPPDDLIDELAPTQGTSADISTPLTGRRFVRPAPPPDPEYIANQKPTHQANVEQSANEMVRLQAGPRSAGKSRLISQAVPQLATPATTVASRNGDSITDRYAAQFRPGPQGSSNSSPWPSIWCTHILM